MNNTRCLYENNFIDFLNESDVSALGKLCDRYHGDAKTTTRDAWKGEIAILGKPFPVSATRIRFILKHTLIIRKGKTYIKK